MRMTSSKYMVNWFHDFVVMKVNVRKQCLSSTKPIICTIASSTNLIYISNNLFRDFGRRNAFIINIYNNSFKHGIWIYIKYFKWWRLQFKGMRKVSLLISVVGFKYIASNRVGNGGYEIFCWDSNTKILKLKIAWYH